MPIAMGGRRRSTSRSVMDAFQMNKAKNLLQDIGLSSKLAALTFVLSAAAFGAFGALAGSALVGFGGLGVALVLAGVIGAVLHHSVVLPVRETTRAAQQLGRGNLTVRLETALG